MKKPIKPNSNYQYCKRATTIKLMIFAKYSNSYALQTFSQFFMQLNLFLDIYIDICTMMRSLLKLSTALASHLGQHFLSILVYLASMVVFIHRFFFLVCVQYKLKARIMCFVKKVEQGMEPTIYPCEHQCYHYGMQFVPSNPFLQNYYPQMAYSHPPTLNFPSLVQQMATDISSTVERIIANNSALIGFAEKLIQSETLLEQATVELEENLAKANGRAVSAMTLQPHCDLNEIPFFSNQRVITKIFGQKEYKYKLNLVQSFPKTIYKERNLNIAVKIANPNGQPLFNANLIHLCVGVCNTFGQWIVEESGDFFIQGKIEIDLYHGQAQFKKVSPKDVSRHFNGGVVNIVIYPKKSLINFTGEVSKYEKIIDPDFIEPLVIRDVVIKAKKKSKH